MSTIQICKDFSDAPGGRYEKEGEHSGEEFREKVLYPQIKDLVDHKDRNDKVTINFDGCYGFGTSFLEEAFGGLVRKYHIIGLMKYIEIESKEDETIPRLVEKYILEAERRLGHA